MGSRSSIKRLALVVFVIMFSLSTRKAYADTAKDLFSKYGVTDGTELDIATKDYNKATMNYRELLKEYAFNDLYNTAVSITNSSDVITELNIYQPMCVDLESKMLSNIDAEISEIVSDENKYISAISTVNFLLSALDSYSGIANEEIPSGDLTELKGLYDEAIVKKEELTQKADIGVVSGIIQPIQAEYKVSSVYGTRAILGNVSETEFHHGIDLSASTGTGVLATFNGTVLYSDLDAKTGETIKIDHGDGIVTIYANLRDRYVKQGDIVKQYQKIGAIGSINTETVGPSLHLSLYIQNKSYDPDILFRKESN